MVALQLLVALVVLHSSDGVLSNGNLKCASEEQKFCDYLLWAYVHNDKANQFLDPHLFKDNKERLSNTNNAIADVLKAENKSELFKHLEEPMRQEVNALSKLMVSCIDETRKEVPQCGDALVEVSQATYALAKATVEVADGSQKETITKACDQFMKDFYTKDLNKSLFELARELGTAVENAF